MKKIIIYYSFILVSIMTIAGFVQAKSFAQITSAILFFPFMLYFLPQVLPRKRKAIAIPLIPLIKAVEKTKKTEHHVEKGTVLKKDRFDLDRRSFLKLIGSAGITVFIFSIFSQKAEGAFFGSVPGPGTIALKDTSGTKIDPAEKHPTDGYKITEVDDSSPSYYGFVDKTGAWFIQREDSAGAYRYTKGSSDFTNVTTGWPNRASLTYNYFDAVF